MFDRDIQLYDWTRSLEFIPLYRFEEHSQFVFTFQFFYSETNGLVRNTINYGQDSHHFVNIPGVGARL